MANPAKLVNPLPPPPARPEWGQTAHLPSSHGITETVSAVFYPNKKGEQEHVTDVVTKVVNVAAMLEALRRQHGFRFEEVEVGDIIGTENRWFYVEGLGPTSPQINCLNLQTGQREVIFAVDIRWLWRAVG